MKFQASKSLQVSLLVSLLALYNYVVVKAAAPFAGFTPDSNTKGYFLFTPDPDHLDDSTNKFL
eukprot:CAMPEP_0204864186 /NCGR_PEP_ID=MMETSP1348-20121228/3885_1 /ASSEMBLY_ACC=CAM_ASM_000700 /TAXON_ID=215587 /ORGANISM="Aplanochytrium stocchinoi, Strain GSBS06" /LENGTH=62 /DNA_ID=CAMNT_0052014745 /DNA_START=17 /DNA_END=202 /DNA_ORIENTATION=+